MLGILEDTPGVYDGEPHYRSVRAVFYKDSNDWASFPTDCRDDACLKTITSQYPKRVEWTIAFDGRNLGQVTTKVPNDFALYSRIGQETITSSGAVPTVGKQQKAFAGWLGAPVLRPLVAVSEAHYADPDHWKPVTLSNTIDARLRKMFRTKFSDVENCTNPELNDRKRWEYLDTDVKTVKAYSSKTGWILAGLQLTVSRCDGVDDPSYALHWFISSTGGKTRFLGSDMLLVDTGDYDNDGKSELVFSIDGYNCGGYRLFYDGFRKNASFEFSFH